MTRTSDNQMVYYQENMVDKLGNPISGSSVCVVSFSKHVVWHYPDERRFPCNLTISDVSLEFLESDWLIGDSNCPNQLFCHGKKVKINYALAILPNTEHHLHWVQTGLWHWVIMSTWLFPCLFALNIVVQDLFPIACH